MTTLGQSQVTPANEVIADSAQGDRRFEAARGQRLHSGMTALERITHGFSTPDDLAWQADQQRQYQEWAISPEGVAWLERRVLHEKAIT